MSTLVSKVSSLFPSRVGTVVFRSGMVVLTPRTPAGRVLVAFHDAIESNKDFYAFAGKLVDLQDAGEFTVAESAVVDSIIEECEEFAQLGLTFASARAEVTAGVEFGRALRSVAKKMASAS